MALVDKLLGQANTFVPPSKRGKLEKRLKKEGFSPRAERSHKFASSRIKIGRIGKAEPIHSKKGMSSVFK